MAAEIAQQPAVLRDLIGARADIVQSIRRVQPPVLRGIALAGVGSSGNSLLFGRYLLEAASGQPATFVAPSQHAFYDVTLDYSGYLAVAASQSGETLEIVEAASSLHRAGATVIALTTNGSSPLATVADLTIDLATGDEQAIPATKTFTAELAILAMIAEAVGSETWGPEAWDRVPVVVERVVADMVAPAGAVRTLAGATRVAVVGRGHLFGVACEAALKLQEAALVAAAGYSASAFRHGPIAAASHDFPVLVFASPGRIGEDMLRLVGGLKEQHVPVVLAGPVQDADLWVPAGLPEPLVAIPAAVRAQQLALAFSVWRGLDPDAPPGLTKVTRT